MQLVDLDVTLVDLPYPVSRKLTVPLGLRLTDLHLVLQAVMGWDNSHLYDFSCGRSLRWADGSFMDHDAGDRSLKKSTLADVLAEMGRKKSFTYTYDMGDSWSMICARRVRAKWRRVKRNFSCETRLAAARRMIRAVRRDLSICWNVWITRKATSAPIMWSGWGQRSGIRWPIWRR